MQFSLQFCCADNSHIDNLDLSPAAGHTQELECIDFGSCALNILEYNWQSHYAYGFDINHHIGFLGASRVQKFMPPIDTGGITSWFKCCLKKPLYQLIVSIL